MYEVVHPVIFILKNEAPTDTLKPMNVTSRIHNFLDKYRWWGNIAATMIIQFFTILFCVSLIPTGSKNFYMGGFLMLSASCVSTTSLYFRYRYPYGSLYVLSAAMLVTLLESDPIVNPLVYLPGCLAAYHAGRRLNYCGRIYSFIFGWVFPALMGVRTFNVMMHVFPEDIAGRFIIVTVASTVLAFFGGFVASFFWFMGDSRRMRVVRQDELRARAMRLEFEQQQERRLAAQDERTRIAREMHDIVAHSLSSIIAQADGARYASAAGHTGDGSSGGAMGSVGVGESRGISEQTLDTIAVTARDSLTQMRSLLGVLRTDEQTVYTPAPTLAEVPSLVEQVRASGVAVDFAGVSGSAHGTLPQGAELAAYRVVQEALTNVLKHARDTPLMHVALGWDRKGLGISVYNLAPQSQCVPVPGTGNGLRGMTERVTMYGGTLNYGPDVRGGFTVIAHLPYREV